jgi:ABC-type transporter Mla MlaB component
MVGLDTDLLSPHLHEVVANGVRKLLLNLTAVTQMDSSGVSAIAKTQASLSRQGPQPEITPSERSGPSRAEGGSLVRSHPCL